VAVSGWPGATVAATRFGVEATLPDGTAYRNQGMQYLRLRWGKVTEDRLYEDTAALLVALRQLAGQGVAEALLPPLAPVAPIG
jgi:hypothetical protein